MHELAKKIYLKPIDVYRNVEPGLQDRADWGGCNPIFGELIQELRPQVIIEVGSWLGESAITMAEQCCIRGHIDTPVICVDTWLGGAEHWSVMQRSGNGLPTLYARFLQNVVAANVQDQIIPLPISSDAGARVLGAAGITADLIYIDGSHEELICLNDMKVYSELLRPGGTMFGHDVQMPGVKAALRKFTSVWEQYQGCWILRDWQSKRHAQIQSAIPKG